MSVLKTGEDWKRMERMEKENKVGGGGEAFEINYL